MVMLFLFFKLIVKKLRKFQIEKLKHNIISLHSVGVFTIDSVRVRGSIILVSGLQERFQAAFSFLLKFLEGTSWNNKIYVVSILGKNWDMKKVWRSTVSPVISVVTSIINHHV